MSRFLAGLAACSIAAAALAGPRGSRRPIWLGRAHHAAALQNPDGGFAPRLGSPSSLGSTSTATSAY